MLFTTDQQTLEDLNIFGKHGSDSIYAIYNRCLTRGGAAVLEEMFQYPLSDHEAINRRSGIIKYFAESGIIFPFDIVDFDVIESYLSNTDERTKLDSGRNSLSKKLSNILAQDAESAVIHKGIMALVKVITCLSHFVDSQQLIVNHPYQADATVIADLLAEPAFLQVLKHVKSKISNEMMAEYDALLRFRHFKVVQTILRHIYYLDVYLSLASVAVARKFVFPKANPKGNCKLTMEGIYHPQVNNAVANSIHITPTSSVVFLTGVNMAGKSTFMKSISICLFLAHMGFPVPAVKMEFSVLDGIYTTINLPDDLGMGASHFYAEVLRVKKMAYELAQGKNLFIVFDELFRGTNVKDAYEATIAITGAFATIGTSMFVISTHIIEAGDVLREKYDNVRFVYLPTKMEGTHPIYTYTLEEGITDDRHGMVIINNEGILDILEAGILKNLT